MNGPRLASDIIELFYGLIELQQEPEEPQQMTRFCFFIFIFIILSTRRPKKEDAIWEVSQKPISSFLLRTPSLSVCFHMQTKPFRDEERGG